LTSPRKFQVGGAFVHLFWKNEASNTWGVSTLPWYFLVLSPANNLSFEYLLNISVIIQIGAVFAQFIEVNLKSHVTGPYVALLAEVQS
jgi:hypothetical protein